MKKDNSQVFHGKWLVDSRLSPQQSATEHHLCQ
jgi:hypothetical protein